MLHFKRTILFALLPALWLGQPASAAVAPAGVNILPGPAALNDPPPRSASFGHTMFASQKLLRTLAPITRSYTSSDAPAAGPRYGLTAAAP